VTAPLLEVRNLRKYFPVRAGVFLRKTGDVHAVDDVSFTIERGRTLGLVGESGCGKSTVGRTLLNLLPKSGGQVLFEGRDLSELKRAEWRPMRREMQIVFQDPMESLNSRHTVGRILEEPFVIHGLGDAAFRRIWVAELLERVGLPPSAADRFPHEFSGGQRQRVGIARAIALSPKVLLLDEPFGMLDSLTRMELQDVLLGVLARERKTVLMVTHDVDEALYLSDRVALMTSGPAARLGGVVSVPFERPRDRGAVLEHPDYYALREELIGFLGAAGRRPPEEAASALVRESEVMA